MRLGSPAHNHAPRKCREHKRAQRKLSTKSRCTRKESHTHCQKTNVNIARENQLHLSQMRSAGLDLYGLVGVNSWQRTYGHVQSNAALLKLLNMSHSGRQVQGPKCQDTTHTQSRQAVNRNTNTQYSSRECAALIMGKRFPSSQKRPIQGSHDLKPWQAISNAVAVECCPNSSLISQACHDMCSLSNCCFVI